MAPARRIERLERELARAEATLARARHREEALRAKLGLPSLGPVTGLVAPTIGDRVRAILPEPVKRPLRRARARLRGGRR
jgi:hypothetical protein